MNIVSQFPPSESSIMRQMSAEAIYTRFLRESCNVPGVVDVTFHSLAVRQVCVVRLAKAGRADPWQAMFHVLGLNPSTGKIVVAVDEDVTRATGTSLIWTIALRVQPHRDTQVVKNRIPSMDPSAAPVGEEVGQRADEAADCSALLIDATRKWPYPPVSLPRKEFMENACKIWEESDCQSCSRESRGSAMSSDIGRMKREKRRTSRWQGNTTRSESERRRIGKQIVIQISILS